MSADDPLDLVLLQRFVDAASPGLRVEKGTVNTKGMTITVKHLQRLSRRCNPSDFEYASMLFACTPTLIAELREAKAALGAALDALRPFAACAPDLAKSDKGETLSIVGEVTLCDALKVIDFRRAAEAVKGESK